ncbi:MAG: hypothetical protein HXY50_08935 [Ignavibacteriaceae bacterium]|nr:hypothetical protein [Ignavibacteriaceae bacterium]
MTKVKSTTGIALTPALKLGLNDLHHLSGFSHEPVPSIPNSTMSST